MTTVCGHCFQGFVSKKHNQVYCSTKCRDAARYQRDRPKRLAGVQEHRRQNRDRINAERRARNATPTGRRKQQAANRRKYEKNREKVIAAALAYQRSLSTVGSYQHLCNGTTYFHCSWEDDIQSATCFRRVEIAIDANPPGS